MCVALWCRVSEQSSVVVLTRLTCRHLRRRRCAAFDCITRSFTHAVINHSAVCPDQFAGVSRSTHLIITQHLLYIYYCHTARTARVSAVTTRAHAHSEKRHTRCVAAATMPLSECTHGVTNYAQSRSREHDDACTNPNRRRCPVGVKNLEC